MAEHVYLVPGFFGFTNLGEVEYFGHALGFLSEAFAARGVAVEVHAVDTPPTSSLRTRAARLLAAIAASVRPGDGPLHLVGHSSGGLDVRLLLSPGVALPTALEVEPIASRVRTAVTIAAPHYGTPVASFFASLLGQRLLQLLSLSTIYVLRFGRLPIGAVLRLGAAFARLDRHLGVNSALLDQLFEQLLGDFSPGRRRAIARLLGDVRRDQALLTQLTPEAMDVFNASVGARAGVRYGSVLTRAKPPGFRAVVAAGLDPSAHASHVLYRALYGLAARTPPAERPPLTSAQARALRRLHGEIPSLAANDGLVPTLSQVWGDVIHVAHADHLDVIGHFDDRTHEPRHFDWLSTGTGFDRTQFEAVWTEVVRYVLARRPAAVTGAVARGAAKRPMPHAAPGPSPPRRVAGRRRRR